MKLSTRRRGCPPGYTLVEIMVAMLIALIVMGGVYRTLLDEDINKERSEMVLEMQNNARVALEHLTRDARRSAFLGCGGEMVANPLTNSKPDPALVDTLINDLTVAGSWTPKGDIISWIADQSLDIDYLDQAFGFNGDAPAGHGLYQEGTDAITLVYLGDERAVDGAAAMTSGTSDINLTASGFDEGDILMATDCSQYTLFQKTNGADIIPPFTLKHELTGLNTTADLGRNYGQTALARVFKLITSTYFISNSGDYNLCHNAANRSIATNIEDLQFEFLADENGDGNLADDLAADNWKPDLSTYASSKDVRAVRIWVLAMSQPDLGYTNNEKYDYPNSPYKDSSPAALAPAGPSNSANRHRFLASAVVVLRNAGLLLE